MLLSDYPVVSVHIPPPLRSFADGHDEVMASGETVGEVLAALGHTYPALGARVICNDGRLADGLSVYLGSASLRECEGLGTPVALEEVVSIVATGLLDPEGCAESPAGTAKEADGLISLGE